MLSSCRMLICLGLVVGCSAASSALSPILRELEDAYISVGENLRPVVVNINVNRETPQDTNSPEWQKYRDLFRMFGITPDEDNSDTVRQIPSQGSGIVWDAAGHILTNSHVVFAASDITVRLSDGREFAAELIGLDRPTDLAVIKIDPPEELQTARLGDSDGVRVGQFAIAVGSPRGLESSVSFGHISALGRENLNIPGLDYQGFIQTDAPINLGNSGGPLCSLSGEVIGINTAIIFGADALGFAIPINTAKKVAPQLIERGYVTRGYLGVAIRDASMFREADNLPFDNGAYVQAVQEDTPAGRADIRPYDVITKLNETVIEDATHLRDTVSDLPPDSEVILEVYRDGSSLQVAVSLGDLQQARENETQSNVLGIDVQPLTDEIRRRADMDSETPGVLVAQVAPNSLGAEIGLQPGSIILDVAKKPVDSPEALEALLEEHAAPGGHLLMRVKQGANLPTIGVVRLPDPLP